MTWPWGCARRVAAVQRVGDIESADVKCTEKNRDEEEAPGEVAGRSPAVKQVAAPACGGVRSVTSLLAGQLLRDLRMRRSGRAGARPA